MPSRSRVDSAWQNNSTDDDVGVGVGVGVDVDVDVDDDEGNHDDYANDDETVIVYKESATAKPSWALSQLSVNSAKSRGEMEPREWQQQQQRAVSHMVSRKKQRKSRNRRSLRRGSDDLLEDCYDDDEDEYEYDGCYYYNDKGADRRNKVADDEFASLRSMMARGQEQGKSNEEHATEPLPQENPEMEPPFNNEPCEIEARVESKSSPIEDSHPPSPPNPAPDGEALCSPPDFDLCVPSNDTDEDEDEDESNHEAASTNRATTNSAIHHSRRVSRAGRTRTRSWSAGGSGRKRNRSDPIHKRGRPRLSSTPTDEHRGKPRHRSPIERAGTQVESVRSLVGLRPTHWSRNSKTALSKRGHIDAHAAREQNCTQPLATASALAAATRNPFHKLSNPNRNRKRGKHEERSSNSDHNKSRHKRSSPDPHLPSSSKPPATQKSTSTSEPASATPITNSIVSFAPSFVPTKPRVLAEDTEDIIGDDDDDDDDYCDSGDGFRVVAAAKSARFSNPRQRPQKQHGSGEWVRALASIRNARSQDASRLQNRARSIALDLNDPRKKARTVTDATILGRYEGPWINLPEDTKLTVLGYAHRHVRNRNQQHRQQQQQQQQQRDRSDGGGSERAQIPARDTHSQGAFFAWFTFTLATARRVELQSSCALRIYNAVVLPCRFPAAVDLDPNALSVLGEEFTNGSGGGRTIRCESTVICTHLCERTN